MSPAQALTPADLDAASIPGLVARSHHLLDAGQIDELVESVYAPDESDGTPWADFGFARWTGTQAIRDGYRTSLRRFRTAVHVVSNLYLEDARDGDVVARYYLQGWHWLAGDQASPGVDFVVLGRMTDRFSRRADGWRLVTRSLERLGPDVAIGALPSWLEGLGEPADRARGT